MVADTTPATRDDVTRHVLEVLETPPTKALADVGSFVDSQRYEAVQHDPDATPRHAVALGGLWKTIRIDEEDIAPARRDMWAGVGEAKDRAGSSQIPTRSTGIAPLTPGLPHR